MKTEDRGARKLREGLAQQRSGDLQGAESCYREALAESPDDSVATHLLGACLAAQDRLPEALPLLDKSASLQPDNGQFQTDYASALRAVGRLSEAEDHFRLALDATPDSVHGLCSLGELLTARDAIGEALPLLRRAKQLAPDSEIVLGTLGTCLARAGRSEEAIVLMDELAGINPGSAVAGGIRATALADIGDIAASEEAARAAVERNSHFAPALWHLALCRYDAGDPGTAAQRFEAAAGTDAGLAVARAAMGIALWQDGAREAGRRVLEQAAQVDSRLEAMVEAAAYIETHRDQQPLSFGFKATHLRHALAQANRDGLFAELGVFMGRSINLIARETGDAVTVHGFDSFEGLPTDWGNSRPASSYGAGGVLPEVADNVELHAGWFEDTLPAFAGSHPEPLSFVNIDCDVYSSTRTFFSAFAERIRPGTILVFDEYFGYPGWRDHEYRAFQEFVRESGHGYRYLALSPITRQATVRIE